MSASMLDHTYILARLFTLDIPNMQILPHCSPPSLVNYNLGLSQYTTTEQRQLTSPRLTRMVPALAGYLLTILGIELEQLGPVMGLS